MKTAYLFSILLISAFCLVPGCAPDSPDSSTPAPSARASAPPARIGERNGVSENEILLGSSAALSGTASLALSSWLIGVRASPTCSSSKHPPRGRWHDDGVEKRRRDHISPEVVSRRQGSFIRSEVMTAALAASFPRRDLGRGREVDGRPHRREPREATFE